MCVRSALEGEIINCAVCGVWEPEFERDIESTLGTCLTVHPTGLVIDLSKLHDPGAESTRSWMTVRREGAGMDPPVHAALCVPATQLLAHRLQQLGTSRFLPVYATTEQAYIALIYRVTESERLLMRQTASPDACGVARKFITEACRELNKPHLLRPAHLVATELVANAVHTGTEITVTVAPRGSGLRLTVSDRDPHLPRPSSFSPPPLADEPGHGLHVVQAIATAWGAIAAEDGKVIWAIIDREPFSS